MQELHWADAKSTHDLWVGAFLVPPAEEEEEEGFKLGSMDENLWDAVILSYCSDGGETKKQLGHPQAAAGFAQEL